MDKRSVIWDFYNIKHIERDHPEREISCQEVEEAMNDPRQVELDTVIRKGTDFFGLLGMTRKGRLLVVFWKDDPRGRYPIHARQAGRKESRRYFND